MENNKGQTIFLSVVGIATLLVAIVGATFAYFSINVTGNETASSIVVQTAKVGGVVFADSAEIRVADIYPGWSVTKHFTITSAADATDSTRINYEIALAGVVNTLTDAADGQFVYTLAGSQTGTGTGTLVNIAETTVPTASGQLGTADGMLAGPNNQHSYVLTLTFKEARTAQDAAQGKVFAATIQVSIDTEDGKRTWDTASNMWKPYTGV